MQRVLARPLGWGGVANLRLPAICIVLAVLASAHPAQAARVYLEGTSYQLRRGLVEGSPDLITPYPPEWTPGPYCFEMAQPIGVKVVADPGENIGRWRVTGAHLFSWVFGDYWTLPAGAWRQPGEIEWLWLLPDCIDFVSLGGDVVIEKAVEPPPPEGEGAGGAVVTDSFGKYSDIYVVLEAPKTPMSPAWASVLHHSCFWAAGEYASLGANHALTDALYAHGFYNGGEEAYTSDDTDSGETFHLKSFLAHPNCPWGQCNDFAGFLVCLSTSVGASEMKAQRTNVLSSPGFWYDTVKPAGSTIWREADWAYHQFALLSSSVWDGCISLYGYGVPKDWARDSTYQSRLVKHYNPPGT
ncbi:MAG: hypothetical protein FJX72_08535, partial [Armatimonadetes bacterium]|nr:hypothetical protein [Armatimonadota bacterium]